MLFFFSSRRRHTRSTRDWSSDVCSSDLEVLEQVREELTDWRGCGMSVMEVSHRSKAFLGVAQEAEGLLRELLAVPAHYKVLFMQGGATGQFSAIPLNLASAASTVDYVN